jgi:hypothetical protein
MTVVPPRYDCDWLRERASNALLRDLELARDALDDLGAIGPLAGVETQVNRLHRNWGSTKEASCEHEFDP